MKCEAKSCEAIPSGHTNTILFGGVVIMLCNEHRRMWELEPKVLELTEEHYRAEISLAMLQATLQGGHDFVLDTDDAIVAALDTIRDTKAKARKLAVEMLGLGS